MTTPPLTSVAVRQIELRGVRVHNLQDLDLDLPLGQLVVLTGVSGSGKSSLLRDTLLAEGRRRFLETLAPSLRLHAERIERPDADRLSGLPPVVSLSTDEAPPRSWLRGTVAEAAGIHELVAIWFSRLGTLYCPHCGTPVSPGTPQSVVDVVRTLPAGIRLQLGFDWQAAAADDWLATTADLVRMGYRRLVADGVTHDLTVPGKHPTTGSVIVDRLTAGATSEARLLESSEVAFHASPKGCRLWVADFEPARTEWPLVEIDGRAWRTQRFPSGWTCGQCNRSLPPLEPRLFRTTTRSGCPACQGRGVANAGERPCPDCAGTGLREAARSVRWRDESFSDWVAGSSRQLVARLQSHWRTVPDEQRTIVQSALVELEHRLAMLEVMGLADLPLDRRVAALSDGEGDRLRWLPLLGPKLTGTLVLLDEPAATCQLEDLRYLLAGVRTLLARRNSVIAAEHTPEFITAADLAVELGPGPGSAGGRITFRGPPAGLLADSDTALVRGLAQRISGSAGARRKPAGWLEVDGLIIHGQPRPDLRVPLGVLGIVTGPSGSGKTEWLIRQLSQVPRERLFEITPAGERRSSLSIAALDVVDQSPLSRSARATPVTWLGAFDEIRDVFAETAEARQHGWTARYFSWQTADGGRCRQCRGAGYLQLDLEFLADLKTVCPECQGRRYRREALEVKYRGRSIAEVLAMTMEEAATFFRSQPRLQQKFQWLKTAGLGYLVLGQPAATLSGGEAQRLKLASRLGSPSAGRTLFLCDRPARGLHPLDLPALVRCLQDLVEIGHSVVVIDHAPELLAAADVEIALARRGNPKP